MQVAVIGAGVIGASIAAELALRGAAVTLIEEDRPGTGTSAASFAYINANGKRPDSYYRINVEGVRAHARLATEHGGSWLSMNGRVEFATDDSHSRELQARFERLHDLGYDMEQIGPERARRLIPGLLVPEGAKKIVHFKEEGHVYPQLYIAAQLQRAREHGTETLMGARVERISELGDGYAVELEGGTRLTTDRVVVAAGRGTPPLLSTLGAELAMLDYSEPGDVTVGYLCTTTPVPAAFDRLLTSPRLNVRPAGGGRLMLQALDLDSTANPHEPPAPDSDLGREFLRRLREVIRDTDHAGIEQLVVGRRVMPADGLTIAGTLSGAPGVYVAATHSGITLAPFLGESAARELTEGAPDPLLQDFRPDRLIGAAGASTSEAAPPAAPRRPGEQ